MSEKNKFPQRLRELRTQLKLSQTQFAEIAGTNQVTLSAYEKGTTNPSLEVVKNISNAFDVSIDWLCGFTDIKNYSSTTTYSDLIRMLVKLCEMDFVDKTKIINVEPTDIGVNFNVNNPIIRAFFLRWKKMYPLFRDGTIDKKTYEAWMAGELSAYEDVEI